MKRKNTIITCLLLSSIFVIVVVIWSFSCVPLVKFTPLTLRVGIQNELVQTPELVTPEFIDKMAAVLYYYRESYRISIDGSLYIPLGLWLDKELVWNYSKKASDIEFVNQIKGKRLGK